MVTIIRLASGNWQVHYTADLGQRYQEFTTFDEVSRFVAGGLLA
jgi:hypothetical protein